MTSWNEWIDDKNRQCSAHSLINQLINHFSSWCSCIKTSLNALWMLPSRLQESKWHFVLSPAPRVQHTRPQCCHFSARHITLKGHKWNNRCHTDISPQGWLCEQNGSKHSGPSAAGLDSVGSRSARFKLLRINGDVCRPRQLEARLTRAVTKEDSSCVTRPWVSVANAEVP